MDHHSKIAKLLFGDDIEEFFNWLQSFDLLDQVEILRQVNELFQRISDKHKDDVDLMEMIARFEGNIESYQESILTELLAKQELDMAIEQRDKSFEEMDRAAGGIRDFAIACIVSNAENAAEMRDLAEKLIEMEKEAGTYDPENWKDIL